MISCFPRCRLIQWGVFAVGLAVAAGVMLLMSDQHLVVRLIYVVLACSLGFLAGRFIALRYATTAHQKLLDILYRSGDPEEFIRQYSPLPRRCKPDSIEQMMTTNYLSCGYAATGEFDTAVSLLDSLPLDTLKYHQTGATALTGNNLCQFYLWKGETDKAREQCEYLEQLAEATKTRQPSVSQNLTNNLRFYGEQLNLLQGNAVDVDYIREEIDLSANAVHRANMQLLLGRALLSMDRRSDAEELLGQLAEQSPRLYAGAEAARILAAGSQ